MFTGRSPDPTNRLTVDDHDAEQNRCTRTAATRGSFNALDYLDAGFAASVRLQRRSVIFLVRPIMHATGFISSRPARSIAKYAGALVAFYVLVYVLLSLCGSYQPLDTISARIYEGSTWAPAGFYDPYHTSSGSITTAARRNGTWQRGIATIFFPLWWLDVSYVHKSKSS